MHRRMRRLGAAMLVWLAAGAGGLRAQAPATPATGAPVAAEATSPGKHILWKVTGATNTVYLLGSVHLLTPDAYPMAPQIEGAFAAAQKVVFEADIDSLQARAPELLARGRLADGKTLRDVVSPETYALLESKLPAYGIPAPLVDQMKPWLITLLLGQIEMQKVGMQPQLGVDLHYREEARKAGKALGALESADFQLGLFDSFTPADQDAYLRSTLEELDSTGVMLTRTKDAWKAGDAATLEASLDRGLKSVPGIAAILLTDRNKRWVPQLEAMLKGDEDVLVIVGAGHLVGREGVVELLRGKGYPVEQL